MAFVMSLKALEMHHTELARVAAAAMQQNYQEAVEICSDLLTSELYQEMSAEDARRARAETRLLMATAMHYNQAHEDDILRVLNAALDSPPEIQKDAWFTIAVVRLSCGQKAAAEKAMRECLEVMGEARAKGEGSEELDQKEQEAHRFLELL